MQRTKKIFYKVIETTKPTDRSRDWILYTLIQPHTDKILTLCLDEKDFNTVKNLCNSKRELDIVTHAINLKFSELVNEGNARKGYLSVDVDSIINRNNDKKNCILSYDRICTNQNIKTTKNEVII